MGGVEKLRIKLSQLSTEVEVEVEAELGNNSAYNYQVIHNIQKRFIIVHNAHHCRIIE